MDSGEAISHQCCLISSHHVGCPLILPEVLRLTLAVLAVAAAVLFAFALRDCVDVRSSSVRAVVLCVDPKLFSPSALYVRDAELSDPTNLPKHDLLPGPSLTLPSGVAVTVCTKKTF